MTEEWSNIVNPFNSMKSLVWADRYEALARGEIPQPVSVTVDPTNRCQLNCQWCQYASWRAETPAHADPDELLRLAELIVDWHKVGGPVAVCIAGGGEPLIHNSFPELVQNLVYGGLQVGVITNGVNLTNANLKALALCRWVGFSVDAGNAKSYAEMKGTSLSTFQRVINNIAALSSYNPRPSIGFKFLLQPNTLQQLPKAIALAKKVGADDFHARPMYVPGLIWTESEIESAKTKIGYMRILENEHFHIYGVTHKFNPNFSRKLPDKCEVTPLAGLVFGADQVVWLCCDKRGDEDARMCRWQDIREFWGSVRHKEMLEKLDTSKCTRRCTFCEYEVILNQVFRQDKMCRAFI